VELSPAGARELELCRQDRGAVIDMRSTLSLSAFVFLTFGSASLGCSSAGSIDPEADGGDLDGAVVDPDVSTDSSPTPTGDTSSCTPACTGRSCGPDGCGGTCGTCAGGKTCQDGQCKSCVGSGCSCTSPEVVCPAGCAVLDTDPMNCGSCGYKCPTIEGGHATCTKGECGLACDGGKQRCGDRCIDTTADKDNCGSCGKRCYYPTGGSVACVASKCVESCSAGKVPCDGYCVDPKVDPNNCGGCGTKCGGATEAKCIAGACSTACATGYTSCSGTCTDTMNDVSNCGGCGKACPAATSTYSYMCSSGKCYIRCTGSDKTCGDTCCRSTSLCCSATGPLGVYRYCGSSTSC
jgi:hypothetical protein